MKMEYRKVLILALVLLILILPALSRKIDAVRFPVVLADEESIGYALSQLNEEAGIGKLAQQVCQNLWNHSYEG